MNYGANLINNAETNGVFVGSGNGDPVYLKSALDTPNLGFSAMAGENHVY